MGFSRQDYWSGVPLPSPHELSSAGIQVPEHVGSVAAVHRLSCPEASGISVSWPGIEPMSPALVGRFLTTGPPGKPLLTTLSHYLCSIALFVRSFGCVRLLVTPQAAARQASLSFTISQSLLKLMFIELVMFPNHLIPFSPLLLLPSVFPRIRFFYNELALHISWPE